MGSFFGGIVAGLTIALIVVACTPTNPKREAWRQSFRMCLHNGSVFNTPMSEAAIRACIDAATLESNCGETETKK